MNAFDYDLLRITMDFKPTCRLLSLPDLVLYEICSLLTSPFDLLNFGSTCLRIYNLSSRSSLWIRLAIRWCDGMWQWIDPVPDVDNARAWLLEVMKNNTKPPPGTRMYCTFPGGERWERVETMKFRCCLGMLKCTYKDKDHQAPPTVLLRKWLYDIALYKRVHPVTNFNDDNEILNDACVAELAALGQAKERDLRARKQRHLNPKYYIKRIQTSTDGWMEDLFPSGPQGSLCPMLLCPSEGGYTAELSGVAGLAACVSKVLSNFFAPRCLENRMTLCRLTNIIQNITISLKERYVTFLPDIRSRWSAQPIANSVISMAETGWPNLSAWQTELDKNEIPLNWQKIMTECSKLMKQYRWMDLLIDNTRRHWRKELLSEIIDVLHNYNGQPGAVTRLNLTDCDMIGGDNQHQEMAAASFVSSFGVLVTWQLIGRGRF